jgi:hypothetical protein
MSFTSLTRAIGRVASVHTHAAPAVMLARRSLLTHGGVTAVPHGMLRSSVRMPARGYAAGMWGKFEKPADNVGIAEDLEKKKTGVLTDDPEWLGPWKEHPRPTQHAQHKNPYIYDDRQERRNFGDPIQENDDIYNIWIMDVQTQPSLYKMLTGAYMLKSLFIACLTVATVWMGLAYLGPIIRPKPHVNRTLPYDNMRVAKGMLEGDSWKRETEVGIQV